MTTYAASYTHTQPGAACCVLGRAQSFGALWRGILDVLAAAATANRGGEVLGEALPEALKNMLLVLQSKVRARTTACLYAMHGPRSAHVALVAGLPPRAQPYRIQPLQLHTQRPGPPLFFELRMIHVP